MTRNPSLLVVEEFLDKLVHVVHVYLDVVHVVQVQVHVHTAGELQNSAHDVVHGAEELPVAHL